LAANRTPNRRISLVSTVFSSNGTSTTHPKAGRLGSKHLSLSGSPDTIQVPDNLPVRSGFNRICTEKSSPTTGHPRVRVTNSKRTSSEDAELRPSSSSDPAGWPLQPDERRTSNPRVTLSIDHPFSKKKVVSRDSPA